MSTYHDLPMLKRHLEGSILTISLNNPDMRNALVDDLIIDLTNTLKQADLDSQVRVVILKGEGKESPNNAKNFGHLVSNFPPHNHPINSSE